MLCSEHASSGFPSDVRQVAQIVAATFPSTELCGLVGRRVCDVGQEDKRLVLYALLLAEAQREDLERFVHREFGR